MIVQGHVLDELRKIPDGSVQTCITSPPYWSLRAYKTEPQIWGGQPDCQHEWGDDMPGKHRDNQHVSEAPGARGGGLKASAANHSTAGSGSFCRLCGAWRGEHGLEPTIELYIAHEVEIFREVRRVLRPDGTCWVDLGDSFWGPQGRGKGKRNEHGQKIKQTGPRNVDGLKPKDLCGIPWRVALALQQPWRTCLTCQNEFHGSQWGIVYDRRMTPHFVCPECLAVRPNRISEPGWWLRTDIIWFKKNPMPESVSGWQWEQHETLQWPDGSPFKKIKDRDRPKEVEWRDCPGCPKCSPNDGLVLLKGAWRPTRSHEYIFFLTKSETYFCDADAVKEPVAESTIGRGPVDFGGEKGRNYNPAKGDPNYRAGSEQWGRTFDYRESCANGRNLRSVWEMATQAFKGAHFATFPEDLVKRCLLAGTSHKVCEICAAPWVRVVEKALTVHDGKTESKYPKGTTANRLALLHQAARERGEEYSSAKTTLGFRPSCNCEQKGTGRAIVLDPFGGSGTTGKVATQLGRDFILIELKPEYVAMALKRTATTRGLSL